MKSKDNKGWGFSPQQRRALLGLLPVLAVASWLVWEIAHPRADDTLPQYADLVNSAVDAPARDTTTVSGAQQADTLFSFDPNTIAYHDLCRLGFTRNEALGIVKYRERGKVFEIPEDFASCYQVSEAMYRRLASYIVIGEKYRLKTFAKRTSQVEGQSTAVSVSSKAKEEWTPVPFSLDTITAAALRAMGFSARQAEVVLNYIDMKGGLRSAAEFAECYVVSDEMFARLEPWLVFPEETEPQEVVPTLVNLNTADSTTLRGVRGIGERTVGRIIDYRELLGGFVRPEQLAEIVGMTEENYARIVPQIFVDSCDIVKIDINFAPAKLLGRHPYISDKTLRKLLKLRQLKGGWNNTVELIDDHIVTSEEAARLAPYLLFRQQMP